MDDISSTLTFVSFSIYNNYLDMKNEVNPTFMLKIEALYLCKFPWLYKIFSCPMDKIHIIHT